MGQLHRLAIRQFLDVNLTKPVGRARTAHKRELPAVRRKRGLAHRIGKLRELNPVRTVRHRGGGAA